MQFSVIDAFEATFRELGAVNYVRGPFGRSWCCKDRVIAIREMGNERKGKSKRVRERKGEGREREGGG